MVFCMWMDDDIGYMARFAHTHTHLIMCIIIILSRTGHRNCNKHINWSSICSGITWKTELRVSKITVGHTILMQNSLFKCKTMFGKKLKMLFCQLTLNWSCCEHTIKWERAFFFGHNCCCWHRHIFICIPINSRSVLMAKINNPVTECIATAYKHFGLMPCKQ